MAEIRLNKIIKQYNIGLQNLVDFLNSLGADIEANPNVKIPDTYLADIQKKFGKDLAMKEESEKVDIKLTEILERSSKKQKSGAEEEEEEYEPAQEVNIKKTSFIPEAPAPVQEPEPEPEPMPEPEPEPVEEPEPVAEPEPVEEPEPEPVEEP